jgi:hypothetical protein
MRPSCAAFACAGLLVLTSTAGGSQDRPGLGNIAQEKAGSSPASAPVSRTEQEWIVRDVVTALHLIVAQEASPFQVTRARSVTMCRVPSRPAALSAGGRDIAYNRDEAARSLATAATLARTRPELVTDWVWKRLQSQAKYAVRPLPVDPLPCSSLSAQCSMVMSD